MVNDLNKKGEFLVNPKQPRALDKYDFGVDKHIKPLELPVPFLNEKIKNKCKKLNSALTLIF